MSVPVLWFGANALQVGVVLLALVLGARTLPRAPRAGAALLVAGALLALRLAGRLLFPMFLWSDGLNGLPPTWYPFLVAVVSAVLSLLDVLAYGILLYAVFTGRRAPTPELGTA